jgi:hypothetical protein
MPLPFNKQKVVEVVVRGNITSGGSTGKPTFNVFHFQRSTLTADINKANVDTAFQAAIASKMILALNNRWTQANNSTRCIDDANDPYLTVAHVNVGAVAGDGLNTLLCAYLLARSTLRKGSYRGAKRFGPLSESDCTAGGDDVLNAGAITKFAAIATAWLAGFTDGGGDVWTPVVFSRIQSQVKKNATTVVATTISQILVRKSLGRMKVREVAQVY